jgi:hypothetical protein
MRKVSVRPLLVPILAVSLCVAAGLATRTGMVSAARSGELAHDYSFRKSYLNGDPAGARPVRPVQPALRHIEAWISAMGASVGLADLDGDGRPNERCLVDPRDDSVTIAPTPSSTGRFGAFPLVPHGVPYDASTTAPMGCVPVDLNEDGYQDVVVFFWGRPRPRQVWVPSILLYICP